MTYKGKKKESDCLCMDGEDDDFLLRDQSAQGLKGGI